MPFKSLCEGRSFDPHVTLGLHTTSSGQKVIRLFRPGAHSIHIELLGETVELQCIDERGLFECSVPVTTQPEDYRVFHQNGLLARDPYTFLPTFSEVDQYLFAKGVHYTLYHAMGGRLTTHHGVKGAKFCLWAPNASSVSLVADFNHWDGRTNPMRSLGGSGVWELFVPGLEAGEKYKFEIRTKEGALLLKSDPYALMCEMRPATASILVDAEAFHWDDHRWMEERKQRHIQASPMTIYEVHLGSWRKDEWRFLNYRDIAYALADYCCEMGFNYVELLPIQEHPLDESWGYQVSGFYAPTSRFGTVDDFKFFINHLHSRGIGVILDWVPGHFPTDDFSLAKFDGTSLYEHDDPRKGYHPHWHTLIFNFGRHEVSNFLIANALYWLSEMHIDGLRVDAVASMLYLDYGRNHGEWIPNVYGGIENLEAIEFIKHFNSAVHTRCQGVLTIAEESTAFSGVSHPLERGGLGFDLKWNMGWMNDTLRYFSKDSLYRHYHHNDLTFGLIYAFSERFVLVYSHDEVVHGKGALLSRMPGDVWQKFANVRLLISYMMCQPGKKLLFMGSEIGQWGEWNCRHSLDWHLLDFPLHLGLQRMVKELNHFYLEHAALWERDFNWETFQWVDFADTQNSVISYLRKGEKETLLCLHNCTPTYHPHYFLHCRGIRTIEEVFNSDDVRYGGSGKRNGEMAIERNGSDHAVGLHLSLAPLATMIFRVEL